MFPKIATRSKTWATFSPLPCSPNPSTTVILQKVIQQLNKCPASYGSRFITVFAGAHYCTLSWNQSNHKYLRTGINTRSAKNTNTGNKFTLYHLVSFQQNYWKFLSTDGINWKFNEAKQHFEYILQISYNKTNQMHWFLTSILGMKRYVFRTVPLSIIRSFSTVHTPMVYVIQVCWQLASRIKLELSSSLILLASCQQTWMTYIIAVCIVKTPDDGQRNCPKHVEFHSNNKFKKLVNLIGFIIRNLTRCTVTWT
jgi:hypothetical protein